MGRALEKRACGMTLASIPQPLTRGQILNGLISEASAHLGLVEANAQRYPSLTAAANSRRCFTPRSVGASGK